VYTIAYRIQYTFTRVHARIPNGHPRDDPREDVGVSVGVGVGHMEFQLYRVHLNSCQRDCKQVENIFCFSHTHTHTHTQTPYIFHSLRIVNLFVKTYTNNKFSEIN